MSRRLSSWPVERSVNARSVVSFVAVVLRGLLVVDFTRYLPGPFASRELMRLGARVVRVETPDGDPLRSVAPGWDDALNYGGWAGLLVDTAPALPPVQIADLAGGSLFAVVEILAALLERERSGRGRHLVVSMTRNAHRLAAYRLHGEPERTLTGDLACYRIYATADDRFLTVTPVEPKFWTRLC